MCADAKTEIEDNKTKTEPRAKEIGCCKLTTRVLDAASLQHQHHNFDNSNDDNESIISTAQCATLNIKIGCRDMPVWISKIVLAQHFGTV